MSLILGIDPGISGSLVVLEETTGKYVDSLLAPTIKIGSSNRLNGAVIGEWLSTHSGITHAFLEKVHSMPKQGVAATFTFGHAAGFVEGIITGAQIPLTLVTPQAWKKHAGLIGTDKDAARSRAIQLFPGLRILDTKAKGQAVADAILIGRYGRTLLT